MKELWEKWKAWPHSKYVLWGAATIMVVVIVVAVVLHAGKIDVPDTPATNPTKSTAAPTSTPTSMPTSASTSAPISVPTSVPTSTPTSAPTSTPTSAPTTTPATVPTETVHTHSWRAATCLAPKTCTGCGAKEGQVAEHNYANLTCRTCYAVNAKDTDEFLEIGSPLPYSTGNPAHCACSLMEWNGLIYRGAGDYNKNSGATDIWAYDPATLKWIKTGTTNEECISKFINLNGVLTAPGIDPLDGWTYGNYYQLIDGKWQKIRKIPGGIHNFDMVAFEDKIFVALGVNVGQQPVKYTVDGERYTDVPLYKNGAKVNLSAYKRVRAYEFFVKDGQLYALLGITASNYEDFYVYCYTGDKMEYVGAANTFVFGAGNGSFNYVSADFTFNGEFYIAANGFFKVTDFGAANGVTKVKLPKNENVRDVIIEGDTAYLLCNISMSNSEEPDKDMYISVYKTKDMKNFEEVYSFWYETRTLSMVKYGDFLYLSMGHATKSTQKNGMMIRIKLPDAQ